MLMKLGKKWFAFFLAVISLAGLTACSTPRVEREDVEVQIPDIISIEQETQGEAVEETEPYTGPTYTVTFYADDGSILWIDTVPENGVATPPTEPEMTYGNVFFKWDSDFSSVTKDLEIHPECQSVAGKNNAFAMAGAYGKTGDSVIVPLKLCGDVCLCGFDLTVTYDPEKLQLESVFNEDGDIIYNDEIPGEIHLNFVSIQDVEADIDICSFKFKVLAENGEIPVTSEMVSIYAGNDDDSMYVPEYTLFPATVYVYQ